MWCIEAGWGGTAEDGRTIADTFLQKAEVPFRIGHHFASKLTDYGRGKGLKIHDIPYSEAQRIYEEQAKDKLPLTEAEFREVISAEYMVFGRKGLGGPQVTETTRAFTTALEGNKKNTGWLIDQKKRAGSSSSAINTSFGELVNRI